MNNKNKLGTNFWMNTSLSLIVAVSVLGGLMAEVDFVRFEPLKAVKIFVILSAGILLIQLPTLTKDLLIEYNQGKGKGKGE